MSASAIDLARTQLLGPGGLDETRLAATLDHVLGHRVDAADLYFQSSRRESWMLEDGRVREGSFGIEQGVGVRAMSGERTGFAYSDEIHLDALTEAADAARSIAHSGGANTAAQPAQTKPTSGQAARAWRRRCLRATVASVRRAAWTASGWRIKSG